MSAGRQRKKRGHRVVHRSLDDIRSGTAKTGVILEEPVGDNQQSLVIAQFGDSPRPEAFDKRELLDIGPESFSSNVVILYPRHLWVLLKRPLVLGVFLVALFAGVLAQNLASFWNISQEALLLSAVPGLLLILWISRLVEKKISSQQE